MSQVETSKCIAKIHDYWWLQRLWFNSGFWEKFRVFNGKTKGIQHMWSGMWTDWNMSHEGFWVHFSLACTDFALPSVGKVSHTTGSLWLHFWLTQNILHCHWLRESCIPFACTEFLFWNFPLIPESIPIDGNARNLIHQKWNYLLPDSSSTLFGFW